MVPSHGVGILQALWLHDSRLLAPTRWKHGDTALMCLATSQIGYSWILRPSTLPPSYVHFLNRHGGRELWHYAAVRVRRLHCLMALTS